MYFNFLNVSYNLTQHIFLDYVSLKNTRINYSFSHKGRYDDIVFTIDKVFRPTPIKFPQKSQRGKKRLGHR